MSRLAISKFGFTSCCLFFVGTLMFRLLLPFGDEPDFTVKALHIKNESHLISSGYFLISTLTEGLNIESRCVISATPTSLFAHIDNSSCTESLSQILLRTAITTIVVSPILFLVVFRNQFLFLLYRHGNRFDWHDAHRRLDATSISLLTPGMFYYLGLLSNEQLTLVLSILIFIFIDKKLAIAPLLALIIAVDFGNSIVVTLFLATKFLIATLESRIKRRTIIMIIFTILAILWIMGFAVLSHIPMGLGPVSAKAAAMMDAFSEGSQADRVSKYPSILRPMITYMSLILFTPNYVKAALLYLIVSVGLIYAFYKSKRARSYYPRKNSTINKPTFSLFWSSIFTILSLTLVFPTYANAKYYVFLIPVIAYAVTPYFRKERLMFFVAMLSVTSLVHLILFRL